MRHDMEMTDRKARLVRNGNRAIREVWAEQAKRARKAREETQA